MDSEKDPTSGWICGPSAVRTFLMLFFQFKLDGRATIITPTVYLIVKSISIYLLFCEHLAHISVVYLKIA